MAAPEHSRPLIAPAEMRTITIAIAACALVSLVFFDLTVARWCYSFYESDLRVFLNWLSRSGESQWYLVPGIVLFALFRKRKPTLAGFGLTLFAGVAATGLAAQLPKIAIGRCRPSAFLRGGEAAFAPLSLDSSFHSMPSGHATTHLSASVALALVFPKYRSLILLAGLALAFLRVAVSRHYISDVLLGAWLGAAGTLYLARYTFASDSRVDSGHA